jgi:hypothetical protein
MEALVEVFYVSFYFVDAEFGEMRMSLILAVGPHYKNAGWSRLVQMEIFIVLETM